MNRDKGLSKSTIVFSGDSDSDDSLDSSGSDSDSEDEDKPPPTPTSQKVLPPTTPTSQKKTRRKTEEVEMVGLNVMFSVVFVAHVLACLCLT